MRPVLALFFGAALSTSALAADLPSRRVPAPAPIAPAFSWTGFYAGVDLGYGFGGEDPTATRTGFRSPTGGVITAPSIFNSINGLVPASPAGVTNSKADGFVGGGHVGYNYQFAPGQGFVVGIEADIQYADFARSSASPYTLNFALTGAPPANTFLFVDRSRRSNRGLDYFGTVRGRIGYAWDRFLVFATGGLAYGDTDRSSAPVTLMNTSFPVTRVSSSKDGTNLGYAVGGGVEYAVTDHITARVEGLYVNIDKTRDNDTDVFLLNPVATAAGYPAAPNVRISVGKSYTDFGLVRAGVSYKF